MKKGNDTVFKVQGPTELLPFLLEHMTKLSRNAVKSILTRKQVSVNGTTVTKHNYVLRPGDTVTLRKQGAPESATLIGMKILYEDDHLIVIRKDAGLLSIASADAPEGELTAYRQLMAYVKERDEKQRIYVVHRLDRDTSGVMMFAKSEAVKQSLQNHWKEAVEERTYVALVEGQLRQPEGTISSWLKQSKTLKMYASPYPNGGQHAVTHYKLLQSNRQFSLVELRLETGRKNQIRVHMEQIGHPVVGDKKYGAKSTAIGRLGLHAQVLAFTHPVTGEHMRFETEIPASFLKNFSSSN